MIMTNYALAPLKIAYDKSIEYLYNDKNNVERIYLPLSYIDQYKVFLEAPTHIIDNIYLGSAFNSACYYTLQNLNIRVIINMTKELTNYYPGDFIYHKYAIQDNDSDNITIYVDDIYDVIINTNENILIHCYMGASRSASVVVYYLMKKYKMSLKDALLFVKDKRRIINLSGTLFRDLSLI